MKTVNLILFSAIFVMASTALAETPIVTNLADGRNGKFLFKSVDRKTTGVQLASGRFQTTDTISGNLILPEGSGPFPAMVIAHGSGGITPRDYAWADYFRAKGIASLIVDSYKERGIVDTVADQSQLTYIGSVADQLLALKLLTTHPQIDANRIGIIGFSRGGSASVGTAFEKLRDAVAGNARFALHLPFYGGCSWIADHLTGAPIHQFIGDSDDYGQPVSVCEAQLKKLQTAGVPSSLNVFKGARHGFDNLSVTKDYYLGRAAAFNKCSYLWNVESHTVASPANSPEWRPDRELAKIAKECTSYGTTLGPNMKATSDAKAIIDKILTETILAQ